MEVFLPIIEKYFEIGETTEKHRFFDIWNIINSDELLIGHHRLFYKKYGKNNFYKWLREYIKFKGNSKSGLYSLNLIRKNDINV